MEKRIERKHRRVRARSVTARVQAGVQQIEGEVENLSRSGLFVRTEELLEVGERVQLDLLRTGGKSVLSLPGLVADTLEPDRAASLGRKTGIGISFEPIVDPDLKERLDQLLRQLIVVTSDGQAPAAPGRQASAAPGRPPPVVAPADQEELQRLRAQVRGLLIDVADLKRSVAERDAQIGEQRVELERLRNALAGR
jgi:hypothetical protein